MSNVSWPAILACQPMLRRSTRSEAICFSLYIFWVNLSSQSRKLILNKHNNVSKKTPKKRPASCDKYTRPCFSFKWSTKVVYQKAAKNSTSTSIIETYIVAFLKGTVTLFLGKNMIQLHSAEARSASCTWPTRASIKWRWIWHCCSLLRSHLVSQLIAMFMSQAKLLSQLSSVLSQIDRM